MDGLLKALLASQVIVRYDSETLDRMNRFPFLLPGPKNIKGKNDGYHIISYQRLKEVDDICQEMDDYFNPLTVAKNANYVEIISVLINNKLTTKEILDASYAMSKIMLNYVPYRFVTGYYDCIFQGISELEKRISPKNKLTGWECELFSFCVFLLNFDLVKQYRDYGPGLYQFFSVENVLELFKKNQEEHPECHLHQDKPNRRSMLLGNFRSGVSSLETIFGHIDHSNLLHHVFFPNFFGGLYILLMEMVDSNSSDEEIKQAIESYVLENGEGRYFPDGDEERTKSIINDSVVFCRKRKEDSTFEWIDCSNFPGSKAPTREEKSSQDMRALTQDEHSTTKKDSIDCEKKKAPQTTEKTGKPLIIIGCIGLILLVILSGLLGFNALLLFFAAAMGLLMLFGYLLGAIHSSTSRSGYWVTSKPKDEKHEKGFWRSNGCFIAAFFCFIGMSIFAFLHVIFE